MGFLSFVPQVTGLKDIFIGDFHISTALGTNTVKAGDEIVVKVLDKHFNSISPENLLKWQSVHPRSVEYDFKDADAFVEIGEKLNTFIIGQLIRYYLTKITKSRIIFLNS